MNHRCAAVRCRCGRNRDGVVALFSRSSRVEDSAGVSAQLQPFQGVALGSLGRGRCCRGRGTKLSRRAGQSGKGFIVSSVSQEISIVDQEIFHCFCPLTVRDASMETGLVDPYDRAGASESDLGSLPSNFFNKSIWNVRPSEVRSWILSRYARSFMTLSIL